MRLPDWHERLQGLLAERERAPFVWGTHDCALWAADCVLALTGRDLGAAYRGTYTTAGGALRALRQHDSVRLPVDLADKTLGPRLPVALGRLGDVVAADLGALGLTDGARLGPALGLCYGRRSLFVGSHEGQHGLVALPTLSLQHCYNV